LLLVVALLAAGVGVPGRGLSFADDRITDPGA
jgi:hypothetical protein